MESYNQSINESSNDTEGVPLFVIYLSIDTLITSAIIVIPPAVQLIVTKATWIIVASVQACPIIILYLLELNSDSVDIALKWIGSISFILLYLMARDAPILPA